MNNQEKENNDAQRLINTLVSIIQKRYDFEFESSHPYMEDGISKVITKGDLRIYFFWDYRESQISWEFQEIDESVYGYKNSIHYSYINTKNTFYESLESIRRHYNSDLNKEYTFYSKEQSYLEYLGKWTEQYPKAFELGDFSIIKHLSNYQQNEEEKKKEWELIDRANQKWNKSKKST